MTTQTRAAPRLRTHLFKACQRCHGDLVLDRESETEVLGASIDYVCLQCGRRAPLSAVALLLGSTTGRGAIQSRAA